MKYPAARFYLKCIAIVSVVQGKNHFLVSNAYFIKLNKSNLKKKRYLYIFLFDQLSGFGMWMFLGPGKGSFNILRDHWDPWY